MKNLPAPVFRLDGSHVATVPPLTSEQEGVSWPAHQPAQYDTQRGLW